MPSKSIIAAFVMALALVGFKLAGVSAHLPPAVAPADIAAQTKQHVYAMRDETGTKPALPHRYGVAANLQDHRFTLISLAN